MITPNEGLCGNPLVELLLRIEEPANLMATRNLHRCLWRLLGTARSGVLVAGGGLDHESCERSRKTRKSAPPQLPCRTPTLGRGDNDLSPRKGCNLCLVCFHVRTQQGVDTDLISLTLRTEPLQHIVIQADGDLLLAGGWLEPTTHHGLGNHLRCNLRHVGQINALILKGIEPFPISQ